MYFSVASRPAAALLGLSDRRGSAPSLLAAWPPADGAPQLLRDIAEVVAVDSNAVTELLAHLQCVRSGAAARGLRPPLPVGAQK